MGNELINTTVTPLSTIQKLEQNADKIFNANQIVINQALPILDEGIAMLGNGLIFDCYNLVVGGSFIESLYIKINKKRALCGLYADNNICPKYASLSSNAIKDIIRFPILVVPEAASHYGQASDGQYGFIGIIEKIRVDSCDVALKCRLDQSKPIPLRKIIEIAFNLSIQNMDRAITELNHTHWTIKPVNLIEELTNAGISCKGTIF